MPRKCPEPLEVAGSLRRVLRRGLPLAPNTVDPVLLGLRGVIARAVDPQDETSLTAALDGVLRGVLTRFPDVRYAEAARVLFALPPARPGSSLTIRRETAAAAAGHELHHFRKRVEPRLIERVAGALLADADRFTQTRLLAPRLAPCRERQRVPADPLAWELVEHEEALSRLWAAIYALRAELLAVERLASLDSSYEAVIRRAETAAWRWALAAVEASDYAAAFGSSTPGGGAEISVGDWLALAGWTPKLSPHQELQLREAAAGGADQASFAAVLRGAAAPWDAWTRAFLPEPSSERQPPEGQRR